MSLNIQGDRETYHPASRCRTDYCGKELGIMLGIWRIAEKAKINSGASQLHLPGSSHSTEPNCHVLTSKQCAPFRSFMRLGGALKQDLNASAHTEILLPCSSASLVSFCWLLFHVWPDTSPFQIHCFLCFHIKFYLHTSYSYEPIVLLFSKVQDLAKWLDNY